MQIVQKHLPGIEASLLAQVVKTVQGFRQKKLAKIPGVSETIDWAQSLMTLGYRELSQQAFDQTLGAILKSTDDINQVKAEGLV
jgi:MoxR-like ATPase